MNNQKLYFYFDVVGGEEPEASVWAFRGDFEGDLAEEYASIEGEERGFPAWLEEEKGLVPVDVSEYDFSWSFSVPETDEG